MEYECSPLSWEFFYQEEGIEELRHSLVYTTLELEATIASAKDEITKRECELIHVNDILSKVIKERDEAQAKCQKLMLEKLELQQQNQKQNLVQTLQQQHQTDHTNTTTTTTSQNEDDDSFECEETTSTRPLELALDELAEKRPLPQKGKLLKAVVEAGPLLQTILLAGPLPQWQHPPPQLNSIEIPPLAINPSSSSSSPQTPSAKCFSFSKKRDLSPSEFPLSKCRKVIQDFPQTPTTTNSHHSLLHPSFS